jgi:hypothetical protein
MNKYKIQTVQKKTIVNDQLWAGLFQPKHGKLFLELLFKNYSNKNNNNSSH